MKARTVMTRPAYTCRLDTTLDQASRSMEQNACGTLAVLDGAGRLAGILTDRDLAMAIGTSEDHPSHVAVAVVMTPNVHTCVPNEDLAVALERMSDAKVRRLPVVDAGGNVEGMLSIRRHCPVGVGASRHHKESSGKSAALDLCGAQPDVRDRGCRGVFGQRESPGVTGSGF